MANLSNINNKFIVTSETEALIGATSWAGVGSGTLAAGLVISGNTSQFILDNPSYNHFTMYSAGDSNIYNIFGSSGNYLIGTGNKDTSSWSEKMRIDSSGFVGINNVAVASQRMTIGATAGQYGFAINALNAAGGVKRERVIFYYNSASDPDAGYLGIKASASDDLNHVFSTGPSNSYVCNITGNFGIGTNSPDTRLHVVGPGGAVNPSSYSVFDVTIENSGQSDLGIIGTTYSGVYFGDAANALEGALVYYHGDNHMSFRTNGNNEKMRITSGGNLVIKGQVNPQLYFESTTSSATMLGIVGADYTGSAPYNANRIAAFNSSHLAFEAGNTERMRINSSGTVTIGGGGNNTSSSNNFIPVKINTPYSTTASPQWSLQGWVATTDGADPFAMTSGETTKNVYMGMIGAAYMNQNRFSIIQGGAERLTINLTQTGGGGSQGFVGIGTSLPSQKLDVVGLVKHQGLDMTAGVQVDQTTSISVFLSGTAGSWNETGIDGTDIGSNGSYVIQVYSNTQGAGASNYSMYWTGTMSWYAFGTNSGNTSEIYLNSAGHYRGMDLELRTISSGNGNVPPSMRINFKSNQTLTGHAVVFKFRRLM
jgi:hypothetical protein